MPLPSLFPKVFSSTFPFPMVYFWLWPRKTDLSNLLQYNHLITLGKGILQMYRCSYEFSHIFLDLDAILHDKYNIYIYISLYLRLKHLNHLNTTLPLQKVLVVYLCGFKNVFIIQLDRTIIQNNAFYIYTLTCPKLRLLWIFFFWGGGAALREGES